MPRIVGCSVKKRVRAGEFGRDGFQRANSVASWYGSEVIRQLPGFGRHGLSKPKIALNRRWRYTLISGLQIRILVNAKIGSGLL